MPVGTTIESRTHIMEECEINNEERGVLWEMRELGECGMEEFGRLLIERSEKTIAILGDRWWPQMTKQEGNKIGGGGRGCIYVPVGTIIESRTHIIEGCEIYNEERGVLREMRKLDECGMEEFDRLERSEKTIAILGDTWWPQMTKQEGIR